MRPKLQLDELNKALLIACGVCYLLSFVLNKYAGAVTVFRLLFAAAAVFLGIRLFSKDPAKRNNENMKFLAGLTAVKEFFQKPFRHAGSAQGHASAQPSGPTGTSSVPSVPSGSGSPGARARSGSPAPNAAISSLPKAENRRIL